MSKDGVKNIMKFDRFRPLTKEEVVRIEQILGRRLGIAWKLDEEDVRRFLAAIDAAREAHS